MTTRFPSNITTISRLQ